MYLHYITFINISFKIFFENSENELSGEISFFILFISLK